MDSIASAKFETRRDERGVEEVLSGLTHTRGAESFCRAILSETIVDELKKMVSQDVLGS